MFDKQDPRAVCSLNPQPHQHAGGFEIHFGPLYKAQAINWYGDKIQRSSSYHIQCQDLGIQMKMSIYGDHPLVKENAKYL